MKRVHGNSPRSAALLICVLVCLLVASSIVMATTHTALRERRNVRIEHQMLQTQLLLDAGILRAAAQLRSSPRYEGETWQPKASIISPRTADAPSSRFQSSMVTATICG